MAGQHHQGLAIKSFTKEFRKDYEGVDLSVSAIRRVMLETERTLYAVSPSLFQRPDYWPASAQVVGYFERDKTANWEPDEELTAFIDRYEKIVFISFGSMTNTDPGKKTETIVDVLKKHGIPAIISTSWGGLKKLDNHPEHILFVNNVPYDWLFPRMYAVVHHGGSGTTHTDAKYACPALVVPHAVDQPFWARTIFELGVGPKGLPIKLLNEAEFEARLLELYSNEEYKTNAISVSEKIALESDRDALYNLIARPDRP